MPECKKSTEVRGYFDRLHRVFRTQGGKLAYTVDELLPEEARREQNGFFLVTVAFYPDA
jgi:hypothetical protein